MDPALKHRLIGAAVLSAIAIIFLPMLMVGHDVNDTASTVPLKVPTAPQGDFQTRELPLVAPSPTVPSGGVVGMDTSHPASPASTASPVVEAGGVASPAAPPAASGSAASPASPAASPAAVTPAPVAVAASPKAAPAASPAAVPPPAPAASPKTPATNPQAVVTPPPAVASPAAAPVASPAAPIPAASAGGHFVVSLGTYSSNANAQSLVASLQAKQLPAYVESVTVAGKPGMRVRIGPFQQRGDAEAARLRAQQVRKDMPTSVTALDAAVAAPAVAPAPAASGKTSGPANKPASPGVASPKAAEASAKKPEAVVASARSAEPGASPRSAEPGAAAPAAATSSKTSTRSAEPGASAPAAAISSKASVGYAVQVTAFRAEDEALKLRGKLRAAGFTAFTEKVQTDSGTLFRVRIGPAASRDEADHLRTELSAKLGLSSMVVAYP